MRKTVLHRFSVIFLISLWTASCGFTPVHAPGSHSEAAFSDLAVAPPGGNRANYIFVRELENRVGRNTNGGKRVEYSIRLSEDNLGSFGREGNRIQIIGNVTYTIVSVESNRSLFKGNVNNFVTFFADNNVTSSARSDALEHLMKILADQTVTQIMARLSDTKKYGG